MSKTTELLEQLTQLQQQLQVYSHAMGALSFDGLTAAPPAASPGRGKTLGALSMIHYDLFINDRVKDLLEELSARSGELGAEDRRDVSLMLKEYRETTCIPKEEVAAFAQLSNEANTVWEAAKAGNDFASFLPLLEKLVEYSKRFAGYRRPDLRPYDAMLDMFEEGTTTAYLDAYFGALRKALVPVVHAVGGAMQPDTSFLSGTFPVEAQRQLAYRLMDYLQVDRSRCALSESVHPFTTNFSKWDVRITTHYHPDNLLSSIYSVIHEAGHGLYELGIDDALQGRSVGLYASMGIHESQSRMYENMIGRSLPFVEQLLPMLHEFFPGRFKGVTPEQLYRAVNVAKPSLIRTEADELTYSLHIMVRYELEKALMEGSLPVKDLAGEWDRLYKEYLGVDVPDDAQGVLQDVHWSGGAFGYFPSYSIGSAYAAQMYAAMEQEVDVAAALRAGGTAPMNAWLDDKVHRQGRIMTPAALLELACGAPFDSGYYTRYLEQKFRTLYQA